MVTGDGRRVVLPAICELTGTCTLKDTASIRRRIWQRIKILRVTATNGVEVDGGKGRAAPQRRDKTRERGNKQIPREDRQGNSPRENMGCRGPYHAKLLPTQELINNVPNPLILALGRKSINENALYLACLPRSAAEKRPVTTNCRTFWIGSIPPRNMEGVGGLGARTLWINYNSALTSFSGPSPGRYAGGHA